MLTKVNQRKFIESGVATRFGPDWPGNRCLANNRRGTPCQKPAITGKNRCQLHGGKSTGPKTAEGNKREVIQIDAPQYSHWAPLNFPAWIDWRADADICTRVRDIWAFPARITTNRLKTGAFR